MGNPSINKRQKEQLRKERQTEKDAERKRRREDKPLRDPALAGVDPDIAGIIPGPQPVEE